MARDYDENETVYRGRRDGLWSAITAIARFEKF